MSQYHDLYIGYYNDFVLCASTNYQHVKTYLKDIRKLPKHSRDIYETTLDDETIISLYEDYLMEEYIDGIFLPARDCIALDGEINDAFKDISNMLSSLGRMRDIYANSDKLMKNSKKIEDFMQFVYGELTSSRKVNEMREGILATSAVLSPDIGDYIRRMGVLKEEHELREMFLTKMSNSKE